MANETRIKATLIDKYVESVVGPDNMMTERYILCFSFDNRIKYFDVSYFTYKKYLVNGYWHIREIDLLVLINNVKNKVSRKIFAYFVSILMV